MLSWVVNLAILSGWYLAQVFLLLTVKRHVTFHLINYLLKFYEEQLEHLELGER